MKKTSPTSIDSSRQQAEEILKSRLPITSMPQNESEILKLIHELQITRIELELKNKERMLAKGPSAIFKNDQIKILDLIDFEEVNKLLEGFNQSTGFVTAILDLEGNVLSKSGWRQICTEFHRVNPETSKRCTISDTVLADELGKGEKYHFYECLNGLVDVAVPIVVKGEHIANLFSGQFFFNEPDRSFFKKQAQTHGFNELKYLKALENVPIVSKEKVKVAMDFLLGMTQLISEITYQKLEQVQLNEALRKSEERSRNALDHLLEGCQIIGFDWRYIYLNRTAEIHNRRPNVELIGNRYMDLWPGIEETEVFQNIKQTLELRVPYHFENEFVFPDGRYGWFDLSIQPVPEGVFILSIDITERKRAEYDLRTSEEKYRLIADNSDDWIYWVAPDGHLNYVSPACERVTGYSSEEFTNHPELIHAIVFEADQKKVSQHTQIAKRYDTPHNLEFRIVTKTGEIRWINHSCSPIFNEEGEYLGRRGTNRNITERKFTEEQLRESELRFSKLYEDGPFGMAMVDAEFKFKKVNPAFSAMMGYTEKELKKLTFKDITHPEDISKDLPNVLKLIHKEISVFKTEKRYIRKDGQEIWVSLTVTANFNDDGSFLYNLAILEDITRRKNAETELKRLNDRISTATSASQVGIWDWDIVNNQLVWDDQMYILYGLKIGDSPGAYEAWLNGVHPDDREYSNATAQRATHGEIEYDTEFRVIWPDGSVHWLKAAGHVFFDESNVPIRMVGVNFDITERKNAEDELKISEERYRNIFESAVIGIYRTTPDGKIIMANSTLIKLLGFESFEELAQRNLEAEGFEGDNQRNKFRESIEKDGYVIGLESVWKTKDGQTVIVSENSKAFFNSHGQVIYYEGTIEDITKRKHIEKTLQESEEKFRKAFATNPDSIIITRLSDGMYVSVNSGFTQIFGHTEEGTVGRTPHEINMWHNPDDRKQFVNALKTKGIIENFEARLCTKAGKIKDTLVSATILEFDGLPHVLSTTKDITERKLAEEALRESEEKFRKLIESIPLPVTYINSLGEISFRNNRFLQIMGYTYEEAPTVNEWWGKAYPDETYRQWVIQNWETVVKNATETNTDIEPAEYKITCKDGIERTMIVSGITIEDNLLITFIDITDRKKAEDKIKELNETLEQRVVDRTAQLKEANQELEAFSYSVSHDLRAPLRHINGFVDLLTENYNDLLPEKGKHYLSIIVNSSRHMGTLIDDLLQFSRTGRQEMRQTKLDMNEVLQEVLKLAKQDIQDRDIEWNISALPILTGDHSLLRMVWYNLLSNAIKFTKAKELAIIQIGYHEEKKEHVFFVRDNGAGFDMRFAHKLFGVFQRLHSTQEFEGTGIGLANVRRIILKHGGRSWAESQLKQGATFYFTLPKNKENRK